MSSEVLGAAEHARLAAAQLALIVILFYVQVHWARGAAARALAGLPGTDTVPAAVDRPGVCPDLQVSALQLARINEQLQTLHARARHHFELATLIFRNYYAGIVCASFAGLVAGGCLFAISYSGWAKADPVLANVAVVMSLLSLFYMSFPRLFSQKQNIARNRELYRAVIALLDEYRTWLATGRDSDDRPADVAGFLVQVDHDLAELDCLVLGLDESAVLTPSAVAGALRQSVESGARPRGGKGRK